ncbi:MAG: hypothetical protein IJJ93_03595, partial [Acidaminococcaceae bacterium]|nr:hypothetical protein [Acidaminococcaceae bacterium]
FNQRLLNANQMQNRIRFWQQAKIWKTPELTPVPVTGFGRFFAQRPAGNGRRFLLRIFLLEAKQSAEK